MSQRYLARKIQRTRWLTRDGLAAGELPADAVTDLKTTGNTLSFWETEDVAPATLREIALAIGAGFERLDKFDIAAIPREALESLGIALRSVAGRTPVADLREKHVDAVSLSAERLVHIGVVVAGVVNANSPMTRVTVREIRELITAAVRAGRVRSEELKAPVRAEIESALAEK